MLALRAGVNRHLLHRKQRDPVLASYLDCGAADVVLDVSSRGKPKLAEARLSFSLSHCADRLVIGVAARGEVGVDLVTTGRDARRSCRLLAPRDASAIEADVPRSEQAAAYRRWWACQEAIAKAAGTGLLFALPHIGPDALQAAAGGTWLPSSDGRRWWVRCFTEPTGEQLIVATEQPPEPIRFRPPARHRSPRSPVAAGRPPGDHIPT